MQAPPNLSDSTELGLLLRAGVDDWGGVSPLTPDHVNPERPWPNIDKLAALPAEAGFELRERLAAQPPYVLQPEPWLDPRVRPHVAALAGPDGLAVEGCPVGLPWQEPDEAWTSSGRVDLHVEVDTVGRTSDRRSDFDAVYGDWSELRERTDRRARRALHRADRRRPRGAGRAAARRAGPGRADRRRVPGAAGRRRHRPRGLCALADAVRADVNGDDVTYVVNRNINFTNVCYTGCRFCAFAQRRTDADAYTLSMSRSATGSTRRGRPGRPRSACRAASTPTCPGRRTSTWPAR